MNKEKYFIDLSKLSKKQIKSLPQIFENAGQEILSETLSDLISGKITDGFKFLFYSPSGWNQNDYPLNGRTEITYPEFIKLFDEDTCPKCRTKDFENCHSIKCPMRKEELFEGGEGETSLQIALKALEDIVNPIGYMKSQLKDGESLNGHYAIMISDKPKFYQDIAKEALEKINSNQ